MLNILFGVEPILCDCNKEDLSIDLEHLATIISEKKPKCLMVVPILGLVPQMDKIMDICEKNNVVLIEDACESLGSKFNDKKLGSFGLMSTFSTYFGHHISTIEGGMICTDNDEFANLLKSLRSHGWDRDMDSDTRNSLRTQYEVDDFNALYTFYHTGFNVRSTDLQAFLGIGQLEKLPTVVTNRNKNFKLYHELLDDSFWKPSIRDTDYVSNFAFPIIHKKRNAIVKLLKDNNIENRPLLAGSLGKQPYWCKKYGQVTLPNVDDIDTFGLYLPNNHQMSIKEISRICKVINSVL